ncbi:phosphoribosyltransferase, partial [bacterium]
MPPSFRDRRDAGLRLGTALLRFRAEEPIVLGIARGGAEVGATVAESLGAPFDIVVVRKIAPPEDREFGVGAIEPDGSRYLDPDALGHRDVDEDLDRLSEEAEKEVARRLAEYRGDRPEPDLSGRTVILVDDGLA